MSWDVLVVGAGATGGWAARDLTEAGLRVLLLEAGPSFDPRAEYRRIVRLFDRQGRLTRAARVRFGSRVLADTLLKRLGLKRERQKIQSTCFAYNPARRHLFVDDLDNPYTTPPDRPYRWIRSRVVGGRTTVWSRVMVRMSDRQLGSATADGIGQDWPLSYRDLAPFYDRVERFLGVHGTCEGVDEVPDGPFLEPRPMTRGELAFKQAVKTRWPDRRVMLCRHVPVVAPGDDPFHPEARPIASSAASTLPAALATGRLELRTGVIARRVLTDGSGRWARGIEVIDAASGERQVVEARVVVLCASTLESTRILLNSRSERHPAGLGNSSGALGHYLFDHTFGVRVLAENAEPPQRVPLGDPGIYIPGIRWNGTEGDGFRGGYQIQGLVGIPTPRDPRRSLCWLRALGEFLPRRENHARLDDSLVDRWSIPALHIDCGFSDEELAMAADQARELRRCAEAAGYRVTRCDDRLLPPGSSIHEMGTARMGADPVSSVLNPHNQLWEVPNLYVTDGAAFPSGGYHNPTLTMLALTARAADHIGRGLARGELAPPRTEAVA